MRAWAFDPDLLASQVANEGDALAVIAALRRRFALHGTDFSSGDVGEYIESVRLDLGFPSGYERDLIEAVTTSDYYRRLTDRIAEVGTRVVDRAVNTEVRSVLEDADAFCVVLRSVSSPLAPGVYSPPFSTAAQAHEWGMQRVGRPMVEVWDERDEKGLAAVPGKGSVVVGMSLVALRNEGEKTVETLRLNWAGPNVS